MRISALSAAAAVLAVACASGPVTTAADSANAGTGSAAGTPTADCPAVGLTLPPRFCATVFADSVGSARHLVVAPNGDVFVNIQAGRRNTPNALIRPGVLALRDTNGDGVADVRERFADTGNTGIGLHGGHLYLDIGHSIVRYPLAAGSLRPSGPVQTVVSGLSTTGHRARNFVITRDGTLLVNVGSQSNVCGIRDRQRSEGHDPCTELETRAGIWRFRATETGQRFSPAARFATGIRNATGLVIHPQTGELFAATHGRDQLGNFSEHFSEEANARLPAEELLHVTAGDNFGWPYCYWDPQQRRRVLAPEYGGDGRQVGRCAQYKGNVAALPAHWAPNALTFYDGAMFPPRYRGGAFIAFHGSWNRAPLRQEGYNVVFVPFTNRTTAGTEEVFADGFAGPDPQPGTAPHRPTGVAVGPDGALYVSDDVGGRIWRVIYR